MKTQHGRWTRNRLSTGLAAAILALVLIATGASGAGAAPLTQECVIDQAGTASSGGGGSSAGGTGESGDQHGGCAVNGASFSVAAGPGSGSPCIFPLPEGIAPGATIIVSDTTGGDVPGCTLQVVEGAGTGISGGANSTDARGSADAFCSIELPATSTGDGGDVTTEPAGFAEFPVVVEIDGKLFQEVNLIEVKPGDQATEAVHVCGSFSIESGAAGIANIEDAACTVAIEPGEDGATTGGASSEAVQGGTVKIEEGKVQICEAELVPGAEVHAAGTASTGGGVQSVTCVSGATSNDPPVCTTQP